MGAVYLAEDTQGGGRVAVKVLVQELAQDDRFRLRFLRESQLAAGLEHPNIVPIVAAGARGSGQDVVNTVTHTSSISGKLKLAGADED